MNMKRTFGRVLAVLACFATVALLLCSCTASAGKTVMEIEDCSVSINMFEFYLTRAKGYMANYLTRMYGSPNSSAFWDQINSLDGTTNNEQYTQKVADSLKQRLCAVYIFEKEGLTLPQSYIDSVDSDLAEMEKYRANGSRTEFNKILSEYGVNYDILREIYIMEAKCEYLRNVRKGQLSDTARQEYCDEYYVRYKQIFAANYDFVYLRDSNGDVIYYDSDGKICYDKVTGTASNKLDSNGDVIYLTEDGRIAYDTKKGVVGYATDKNGERETETRSEAECSALYERLSQIKEATDDGNTALFESYIAEMSEDASGSGYYENGYYLDTTVSYAASLGSDYVILDTVSGELENMSVGETRLIAADNGYYLIMKYEMDDMPFNDSANSEWFSGLDASVAEFLVEKEAEQYYSQVKVDSELLATVDMKSVSYTNYYY